MKDHFPLDSTLGRKKGGRVDGDFDAQGGGPRETVGGLERTGTFDGKEHARVWWGDIAPTVLVDEVGLEPEEPPVGTGVGGAESVRASEGDAGPGRPVVHSLYVARETDDWEGGVGHWGRRMGERARRREGRGPGKRKVLEDEREAPSS